jgi:hypothetical protein
MPPVDGADGEAQGPPGLLSVWGRYRNMKSEKRQLGIIGLIAAICACGALSFDYEFFMVVFVLESAVANMLAFL